MDTYCRPDADVSIVTRLDIFRFDVLSAGCLAEGTLLCCAPSLPSVPDTKGRRCSSICGDGCSSPLRVGCTLNREAY